MSWSSQCGGGSCRCCHHRGGGSGHGGHGSGRGGHGGPAHCARWMVLSPDELWLTPHRGLSSGRGSGDIAKLCAIKSARIKREKKTCAPVLESLHMGAGMACTAYVSEELG